MSYRLIEKQVIYDGQKVRLEVHHLRDEETEQRTRREVCVHPGAVVILGLLNDPGGAGGGGTGDSGNDPRVVLIRNRRYAIGQTLVELPAGTLEKGELPIDCAGRELLEETGYLAGRLKLIGTFFTSPGILSEKMYAYAAYDLQLQGQALEAGEEIEVLPVGLREAIDMIPAGEIQDAKTIATLLMFDRFQRGAQ